MKLTLDTDAKALRARLAAFSDRRFNASMATALTRTAVQVRDAVRAEMRRVLDRPTPYTLRQLRYVRAKADRLAAAVGFNVVNVTDERGDTIAFRDLGPGETPAGKYLTPQIEGGPRRAKRLEVALRAVGALPPGYFAVPAAGAKLDAYGNVTRGQVVQILSQLRIQLLAGTNRNMSFDARGQIVAQRRAGGRYFLRRPGEGKVQPGIYQRELIGRNITPVFIFVRAVQYRRRFDFYGLSARLGQKLLPAQVERAIGESMARMRGAR